MYRTLNAGEIAKTVEVLHRRITERFPDSGLSKVSVELLTIAKEAMTRAKWIEQPRFLLRLLIITFVVLLVAVLVSSAKLVQVKFQFTTFAELVQASEATFNTIVLFGAALFSLITLETRIKRKRALQALHELRVLAHIIDMHQLTKDPEGIIDGGEHSTSSSPKRSMSTFELSRYLDYCSEMLSLISKIAALYAQKFQDSVALSAVDSLENLTNGLSRKIWQKIMLLHAIK